MAKRSIHSPHVLRPVYKHYNDRITIDLDAGDDLEIRAVRCWYNLLSVADGIDVHVSSSGEGLHFVGYFEDTLEKDDKLDLRRALGDDARRVDMEAQRHAAGLPTNVTFDQKGSEGGTQVKERRFTDIYDALTFIRENSDDYDRVKSLANKGHKGCSGYAPKAEGL